MGILTDVVMATMDPGPAPKLEGKKVGDFINDYTLTLSSYREINTSEILQKGPLLLIFIRGTWCPFCRMHMKRIRDWIENLEQKKGTAIIVSSEPIEVLQTWLENNPMSYLFASDPKMKLAKDFGVYIAPRDFSQAATFLIDIDKRIRLAYRGKRTKKNFNAIEDALSNS